MFACIHSGDPTEAFLNWGKLAILREMAHGFIYNILKLLFILR